MATLQRNSKKIQKPISSNGKCGEITYCVQVGKRVYALNCIYCPQICLQWDMFINHMENDHYYDLNSDSEQPMESEEMELQIGPAREVGPSVKLPRYQNTPLDRSNKPEASDHCSFNNPLEDDNTENLMSIESTIKIENPDYPSDHAALNDTNSFHCDKIGIDKSDYELAAGLEQNLITDNSNSSMTNNQDGRFATIGDLNSIKCELREDLQDTEINLSNDHMETSRYPSYLNIKHLFGNKFKQMNDTILNLKDIIINQNDVIMKSLAEQKVLAERILRQEVTNNNARDVFPIKSITELNEVNKAISEDNREIYIDMMKKLLEGRLPKTLTEVISMSVCLEVNMEGIHGKKRLKDFKAFYDALTDACRLLGTDEVEKEIRNALKVIKKRHIHAECMRKKVLN